MKKIKKLKNLLTLILSAWLVILTGCDTQTNKEKIQESIKVGEQAEFKKVYSDALEYNDALVGLQTKYGTITLEIEEYKGKNIEDVIELNEKLKNECEEILTILEKMSFEGSDDYGMKSSLIKQVKYVQCCYMNDKEIELLGKIMLMEDNLDTTDVRVMIEVESIFTEYYSVIEATVLKTQEDIDNFLIIQKKFAEANNFTLTNDNPLDERIDALKE